MSSLLDIEKAWTEWIRRFVSEGTVCFCHWQIYGRRKDECDVSSRLFDEQQFLLMNHLPPPWPGQHPQSGVDTICILHLPTSVEYITNLNLNQTDKSITIMTQHWLLLLCYGAWVVCRWLDRTSLRVGGDCMAIPGSVYCLMSFRTLPWYPMLPVKDWTREVL